MLLIILLSFLQLSGPLDSSLMEEAKSQTKYYFSNIESKHNLEENIWALTTLATENVEIKRFTEDEIQNGNYNSNLLGLFQKVEKKYINQLKKIVFNSGSNNLLVELLLVTDEKEKREKIYREFSSRFTLTKTDEIDFHSLCQSIIEEGEISTQELSNNSFLLPHFFLLYRNPTLIPDSYLEQMTKKWSPSNDLNNNLRSSLFQASYLRALYLQYKYREITSLYSSFISEKTFPNSNLRLRLYSYLDYSTYRLGHYDQSLQIVRNFTLPLTSFLGKEEKKTSIKQLQGVYLYNIGKIHQAEKVYQSILKEVNKKKLQINLSSLYNNLALSKYKLGKYDEYLSLQLQALEIAKKTHNYSHQIKIYSNLFIYHRQFSHPENALDYLDRASKLARDKGNSVDLGKIYTLLGSFYAEIKRNFDQAITFFQKAEETLNPQNDAKYYIDLLKEKEKVYKKRSLFNRALETQNKILTLAPSKNSRNHIDALVNKALIYLILNDIENAAKLIQKYASLDLSQLDFQQIIKAKTVEADYLNRRGKSEKAINILEPALNQVIVRAKSSTDLKSGFWHVEDEYLDAFELAVSIYMENGKPEKAIEKLDQLKTINDASFYQNPLVKSSLLNESELTEYKKLTDQLDVTRKKLLTAPESQQFDIQQKISQLKLKKRKLDRKLTKDIDSNPISIQEVQNKLSARKLVVHITELNEQFYIAQISRSDVKIETIPLNSELRNLLTSSAQQIATHQTNLDSLYKISQILGIQEIPDRIEQITLIPDSYFYQLPVDVLPLEKPAHSYSYGEVKYAIEKFRTQYLTSLADFRSPPNSDQVSKNKLSYVGYGVSNFSGYHKKSLVPLPFAQKEVSSIANKLTHLPNIQTYINEQSTKTAFTNTAPNARIIHLATHSEVSERDPMFSTVYLSKAQNSPDSTFDDQIFAYELFELNLSNEMIMLNSCESGSGSYIQGTGVMGISRALQYAGARSLILNLWSVNDMLASDFAIHFYDQLNQGKSKAEALRNTKRYFLRTKNASPHFWGPYMLIGDINPIVKPNKDKNLAMASAFIFYFLLMIGLSYLTQKGYIFHRQERKTA